MSELSCFSKFLYFVGCQLRLGTVLNTGTQFRVKSKSVWHILTLIIFDNN